MSRSLLADDSGFIISAELVLVATILVIGVIVGLSEVQHAVVGELNDVADAIGSANQSYSYSGFSKRDWGWGRWGWGWGGAGTHAWTAGSMFVDLQDACDMNQCMLACNPPVVEAPKVGAHGYGYGYGYGQGGAYGFGGAWAGGGAAASASSSAAAGSAAAAASAAASASAAAAADAAAASDAAAAAAADAAAAAAAGGAGVVPVNPCLDPNAPCHQSGVVPAPANPGAVETPCKDCDQSEKQSETDETATESDA